MAGHQLPRWIQLQRASYPPFGSADKKLEWWGLKGIPMPAAFPSDIRDGAIERFLAGSSAREV
ncbi:hypothetical protein, partial [Corynebacterium mucifaciens]|uniref:hypothetical protein n=1 Tax=Corynebacterium mucifaciens TaxID=57171 RepID=UPI001B34ABAD